MSTDRRAGAAFGPTEAAAFAREYANASIAQRPRRRQMRRLARRIQAAWRAWQSAGRLEPL